MTKEEAIKVLDQVRQWTDYPKEAFTMAIEALSKPSLPSNLDEAANKFAVLYDQGTCDGIAQECFKAGAEWMAEQGVSYQDIILADKTILVLPMKDVSDMGLDYSDKVIVQIRKRD